MSEAVDVVSVSDKIVQEFFNQDGEMFKSQIKICSFLSENIENISKFLGFYQENNTFSVFYEKIPGISVKNLINTNGGLLQIPFISKITGGSLIIKY